jgi:15-cis-phytoene synthase
MQAQPAWESTLLDWAHTAFASTPLERHAQHAQDARALHAAYLHCEQLTKIHSRTFFVASGLLPPEKRQAVRALYAFCRVTDDVVDRAEGSMAQRRLALMDWRDRALHSHPSPDDPVAFAWADARARFQIPVGYAEQLINGVARDLDQTRYATFDDLAAYSYGVASTVGLMAMHIIGFAGEHALPYAVKLGVALQMTNILRDVAEDWKAGRLYLPQDELADFGLTEADIHAMSRSHRVSPQWCAFMRFQIERNRQLYVEGDAGVALLHANGRFAIGAASGLYQAILGDIERHNYDVFSRRAHISASGKLRRLPAIWLRSRV